MNDSLIRKSIENHFKAIDLCLGQSLRMPALILIYSALDFMAWLARPKENDAVDRKQFMGWAERYVISKGFSACSATDLYSARCAHIHGNNFESSLIRKGEAHPVFYAWGNASPNALQAATDQLPLSKSRVIHVETLFAAVKAGAAAFLLDARADAAKWELVLSRSEKLFDENPDLDLRVNAIHKHFERR